MLSLNAKLVVKRTTQKYSAPPSVIFPLLCPVREYDWLDGWTCKMIYSESGFAEEGCIFTTQFHGEEKETIWVITKHDNENHEVQFIRLTPDSKVVKMAISLKNDFYGNTNAHFIYTYTALNEKANTFIENQAEDEFKMIAWMEKSINYFLETGKKLVR